MLIWLKHLPNIYGFGRENVEKDCPNDYKIY